MANWQVTHGFMLKRSLPPSEAWLFSKALLSVQVPVPPAGALRDVGLVGVEGFLLCLVLEATADWSKKKEKSRNISNSRLCVINYGKGKGVPLLLVSLSHWLAPLCCVESVKQLCFYGEWTHGMNL